MISHCTLCSLCQNQPPLLDNAKTCDVMWVGLSAKKVLDVNKNTPLEADTPTGKIIKEIEESLPNVKFYKTNLVKCLPLNEKGKLRYPTKEECLTCLDNLLKEIKELQPKVIVLLGKKVSSYVLKGKEQIDASFIHALHPSYIYVYKRNSILEYEKKLKQEIEKYL